MRTESYALAAPVIAPIAAAVVIANLQPLAEPPSFEPSGLGAAMGWAAVATAAVSMIYSLRKRLFLQGVAPLRVWKAAHVIVGYVFLALMLAHSGSRLGTGVQLALNVLVAGITASGVWGLIRQGTIPELMTRTLLDPVYKSELQDEVNTLLEEIDACLSSSSTAFHGIYQRHILPYLSIKLPTAEQQKSMMMRCFGPPAADPNAAVKDLVVLDEREREKFYSVAARALDVIEIRRSQAYQRWMNGWLTWHIGLTSILAVFLLFHVMASFYF